MDPSPFDALMRLLGAGTANVNGPIPHLPGGAAPLRPADDFSDPLSMIPPYMPRNQGALPIPSAHQAERARMIEAAKPRPSQSPPWSINPSEINKPHRMYTS